MAHNKHFKQQSSGIALLMTIMVLSVVVAVTLALVELTLKQLALSVDSKDSEIAFHAANAGLECARYARRAASSTFESGAATAPFTCFGTASPNGTKLGATGVTFTGTGNVYRYTKSLDWSGNRCSEIDLLTMMATSTLVVSGIQGVYPGYGTLTKTCVAGAICTVVSVAGYNSTCANKNTAGVLKREVLLEF